MSREPRIADLARWQRRALWLVLAAVLMSAIAVGSNLPSLRPVVAPVAGILTMTFIVLGLALIIALMAIQAAMGTHPIYAVILGLATCVPVLNILVLVFVNLTATEFLKDAGLKVGLLGVSREELKRALDPGVCRKCGYDLTGNTTGRCPECGHDARRKSNNAEAST